MEKTTIFAHSKQHKGDIKWQVKNTNKFENSFSLKNQII